jgi:hypothetical protein
LKKYNTLENQNRNLSKAKEIKKRKQRVEKLTFVKNVQQDMIAGR